MLYLLWNLFGNSSARFIFIMESVRLMPFGQAATQLNWVWQRQTPASLSMADAALMRPLAFGRATVAFRWLRDRWVIVTALSGAVLIAMGLLLLTGELTRLNSEAQQALDGLGLDIFSKI